MISCNCEACRAHWKIGLDPNPPKNLAAEDLPEHKGTVDLVLCQEIRFGKNGNFKRYVPIKFPNGCVQISTVVIQPGNPDTAMTLNISGDKTG